MWPFNFKRKSPVGTDYEYLAEKDRLYWKHKRLEDAARYKREGWEQVLKDPTQAILVPTALKRIRELRKEEAKQRQLWMATNPWDQ